MSVTRFGVAVAALFALGIIGCSGADKPSAALPADKGEALKQEAAQQRDAADRMRQNK
jgi:hypothetical protein